jgi:cobalt-zinc-cadmium resistance protein CzcA
VTIGHEVRQGAVVKNGQTEAVGGIVMMMRGGNAKEVVSRVKARVAEINERACCRAAADRAVLRP